ncbi:MAG: aspartate carbamoyltransferase catalytic subunit [Candidatus Binatia bacterium]
MFAHRHLLGIEGLSTDDLQFVLDTAQSFREISEREVKKVPTLRGKTIINLFYESSTRTRTSFEIAAKRLSADAINISTSVSSVTKGETLIDTARNLIAMRPSAIVIRHPASGAPHLLARLMDCPVINAGDGTHEHPTQALLDAMTIREHKGEIAGLTIAIVGDVLHSRVARSNTLALTTLGAKVRLIGPPTLLPPEFCRWGVELHSDLRVGLAGADVVMALRLQRERQDRNFLPSAEGYSRHFCITAAVLAEAKPDVLVMHPGPMNRGIEIASEVADGPYSVILDQVTNGVAVRMALLYLLTAQGKEELEERSEPAKEERVPRRRVASR